jgi:hypothetical protein
MAFGTPKAMLNRSAIQKDPMALGATAGFAPILFGPIFEL